MADRFRLREAFNVGSVGKIDRDACVVHDVRVCGVKSGNGKSYSPAALKNAIKLYEGCKVMVDHPAGDGNERRYGDRFGRLFNVRVASDGSGAIQADLRYNPAHALAEQFLWDAQFTPAHMGLSHNAEGNGRRQADGTILVESITRVHSVDLVDGPATNFSLFESLSDDVEPLTGDMDSADDDGTDSLVDILRDLLRTLDAAPNMDPAQRRELIHEAVGQCADALTADTAEMAGDSPASVRKVKQAAENAFGVGAEQREQQRSARILCNGIDWHSAVMALH